MRMSFFSRLIAIEERETDKRRMLSESDFVRVQNGADWRGSTAFPKCIINFVFSKLNLMKRIEIIFSLWESYLVLVRGYDYVAHFNSEMRLYISLCLINFNSTVSIGKFTYTHTHTRCTVFGVIERKMVWCVRFFFVRSPTLFVKIETQFVEFV